MSEIIGHIYTTGDYTIFKKLQGNRDVKGTKKIIDSINSVGYVLSPILVNEKYEVIDGQNRLEALKRLGLPVPYIVQEGIGLKECRHLNIGQSNWSTKQFIESYAEAGSESYIRLLDLVNDFAKQFSIEGVLSVAVIRIVSLTGGWKYNQVREGSIDISEEQYETARRRLTSMVALGYVDFKERYNMSGRTYWGAVSYAYAHKDVDPRELIRKMNEDPNAIISCSKLVDQLRYFDDAYNRRKLAKNKVFMAADIQKGLYI